MRTYLRAGLRAINLPREVCHWCFGKDHHILHRLIIGLVIMVAGALLADLNQHGLLGTTCNIVGEFLRALGIVPFAEHLLGE